MTSKTFTMIKPDAVSNGFTGAILAKICETGFVITSLKMTQLTRNRAAEFYAVHQARPFFGELVEFMSSGPIVAAILEKSNAVEDFRSLIGATNPAQALEGTIRKIFAESLSRNAIHGSDSNENALIEGDFFFSCLEKY
ncbi:MAG: nucleoside-diphosphate kinase [Chitinophagaceae bacterium]